MPAIFVLPFNFNAIFPPMEISTVVFHKIYWVHLKILLNKFPSVSDKGMITKGPYPNSFLIKQHNRIHYRSLSVSFVFFQMLVSTFLLIEGYFN